MYTETAPESSITTPGFIPLAATRELSLAKTFECGQCFRWRCNEEGVWSGVAYGWPAKLLERDNTVYIMSKAPLSLWREYFDLDRDYETENRAFCTVSEYMRQCVEFGRGIRILRQEKWEALCSFIISQCNNIRRIQGIVERLCALCGNPVELDGECFRTFPSAATVAELSAEQLAPIRSGYRAQYIIDAALDVSAGKIDLDGLTAADYKTALDGLLRLNGVGAKVANCAVLFGLGHMEGFPIDVWMKRALSAHFPPDFDPKTFGPCAGIAQQYIFHMERTQGKEK